MSAPSGARSFDSGSLAEQDVSFALSEGSLRRHLAALIVSVAAHLILLAIFGLYLKFSPTPLPSRDTIEVSVVDLLGGRSKDNGDIAAETTSARKPAIHAAVMASTVAPKPKAAPRLQKAAKFITRHASLHIAQVRRLTSNKENRLYEPGKAVALSALAPKGSTGAGGPETGTKAGTRYDSGSGISPGAGTSNGFGTGGDRPHAIFAPVPSIPDDMRDELMHATAIARFKISHNGTVTVALLSATDFSELNDIILDTLRKWRFLPATKNGVAVDSEADVRLLISVR